MKLHFITFGAGNEDYHKAVERICTQAKRFNLFKNIFGFTEKDLHEKTEFWETHGKFITENTKGFGYWIWKCFLLLEVMNKNIIEEGDIILFADSGCELNIRARTKMFEYIKLVLTHDILAFQMENLFEKMYTKMDLLEYAKVPEEHRNSSQLVGGILFIKKTAKNIEMLKEIFELTTHDNYHLLDDSSSILPNDPSFIEHRHDQSCFSIILKKYRAYLLKDETFFENLEQGLAYPVLAMRNRTGQSFL